MRVSVIDKDIRDSLIHHNSEILRKNIITKIHSSVYEKNSGVSEYCVLFWRIIVKYPIKLRTKFYNSYP